MQGRRVPDQFAVYRDSDNSVLGVVGSQYVPLQNAAAFDWFRPFLDARQCAIETCGSLMGGRIVWVLAKLDREDSVIVADSQRPDVVSKFLLLTTSHDGSKATRVGFVPIRVVCWNTLSAAIHAGASQLLKVKHTKSQGDALAAVRETVDTVNAQFEATADQYRKLVACRITKDDLAAYVKLVMQVDEGTADKPKVIGTRMSNIVDRIIDRAINGIGQDIAPASAWAAFNGVTEYLTYERGHSDDNRLRSLWYGDSANINSRALKLALAMAG
jgi:phage/plasmid-like protein (TIGR03299 family)